MCSNEHAGQKTILMQNCCSLSSRHLESGDCLLLLRRELPNLIFGECIHKMLEDAQPLILRFPDIETE